MRHGFGLSLVGLLVAAAAGLPGCGRNDAPVVKPPAAGGAPAVPHFTDVLPQSGVTFRHQALDSETGSNYRVSPYDHGSGLCLADFDGDGRDDLYFLNFGGPNGLFLNRGGFRFEDATARSGAGVGDAVCVGAAAADYDADGDVDLYVTTYRGGNRLFRNRGDATFEDVTRHAGVAYDGHSSAAVWLDFDGDGDLDLYLANLGRFTRDARSREAPFAFEGVELPFEEICAAPGTPRPGEPNVLWRNNGDGTFTDATRDSGLTAAEWNGDAAAADVDLDGDPDLYVSNMFGPNHLFLNEGGRFRDVTAQALGRTSWGGMGARFFDGDGDAYPDLFVADMHSDMWTRPGDTLRVVPSARYDTPLGPAGADARRAAAGAPGFVFGSTYFVNRGDGTFAERGARAGLETWWPWGAAAADFNADGFVDLFLPSGMGFPYDYWPNALFLNDGRGRFREAAAAAGVEPPRGGRTVPELSIPTYTAGGVRKPGVPYSRSSRAAAVSDLDGDGDPDLVVANFNHPPYLLRNDGPAGHWLQVRLAGRPPNTGAVGARVLVEAGSRVRSQQLYPGGGYLSQSGPTLHFGLGDAARVDRVTVFWPGRSVPQVVESPSADRVVTVRPP